jgi:hypothetical protein
MDQILFLLLLLQPEGAVAELVLKQAQMVVLAAEVRRIYMQVEQAILLIQLLHREITVVVVVDIMVNQVEVEVAHPQLEHLQQLLTSTLLVPGEMAPLVQFLEHL